MDMCPDSSQNHATNNTTGLLSGKTCPLKMSSSKTLNSRLPTSSSSPSIFFCVTGQKSKAHKDSKMEKLLNWSGSGWVCVAVLKRFGSRAIKHFLLVHF